MPRKFSTQNPKSVAARERKNNASAETEIKKQQEQEDNSWVENDKKIMKRLQKREIEEKKKQEHNKKKSEAKALLENELEQLTKKIVKADKETMPKLRQAQINKNNNTKKSREDGETHLSIPLEENVNRIKSDENVARTVDEAISVLAVKKHKDRHPERRMKTEYRAFEKRRLEELKTKNSTLRLSQMKQLIFMEWQKSPENPLNVNSY